VKRYTLEQYQAMQQAAIRASLILDHVNDSRLDFHTLPSWAVDRLLKYADTWKPGGYRKPKNANGSRARYFHQYLLRLEARAYQSYTVLGEVAR
jgi:hypothetical protein